MNQKNIWKQGEDGFSIYVEDERGHVVADVRAPDPIMGETLGDNMERHRVRARLMAGGPMMLETLHTLNAATELSEPHRQMIKAVIAAVENLA